MVRNFRTNISETVRLMDFSSHTFDSAYTNWLHENEIISRRHGFVRPRIIKGKRRRRLLSLVKLY